MLLQPLQPALQKAAKSNGAHPGVQPGKKVEKNFQKIRKKQKGTAYQQMNTKGKELIMLIWITLGLTAATLATELVKVYRK